MKKLSHRDVDQIAQAKQLVVAIRVQTQEI